MVDITERLRLNEDDWLFGPTARTAKKEITTLRDELAAAKAEIERLHKLITDHQSFRNKAYTKQSSLNKQLAAAKAEITELKASMDLLGIVAWKKVLANQQERHEKELAARDLVIKQMQAVLVEMNKDCVTNWPALKEAATLQPTTEALDEYVQRAVLEEREACAALCESRVEDDGQTDDWSNGWNGANYGVAAAIRGRKS